MANISNTNRKAEKEKQQAAKNRREIVAAGLSRRDMLRMGYERRLVRVGQQAGDVGVT